MDKKFMAAPKTNVTITIDAKHLQQALKAVTESGAVAAAAMRGLSGAAANVAKSVKDMNFAIGGEVGVVSRGEFKQLAEKYGRCSQRMSMLLSLISVEELKRIELLPADLVITDVDGFDRVTILNALDAKVDQFNAAHQRLTGKRKKVPDPGQIELSQEEMARVFAAKQAGISTEDILKEIKQNRLSKPIRL